MEASTPVILWPPYFIGMHPLLFTCITLSLFYFLQSPGTKSLMCLLVCCLSLYLQNLTRALGHYPSPMCPRSWSGFSMSLLREGVNNLKSGFYGKTQWCSLAQASQLGMAAFYGQWFWPNYGFYPNPKATAPAIKNRWWKEKDGLCQPLLTSSLGKMRFSENLQRL